MFKKNINRTHAFLIILLFALLLAFIDRILYFKVRTANIVIVEEIEKANEDLSKGVDKMAAGMQDYINNVNQEDAKEWSLYENSGLGISFRYPKYYAKYEYGGRGGKNEPVHAITFSAFNDEFTGRIAFMVFDSGIEKALRAVVKSLKNIQKSEISIADKIAIKITGTVEAKMFSKNSGTIAMAFVAIENNQKTFVFIGEDNEVFKKLVATIQF